MLFMVVEKFRQGDAKSVYRRFRDRGRQTPDALKFVSSYVTADCSTCFQLMECDDVTLLQAWVSQWQDLVEFTIYPVTQGKDTAAALQPLLDKPS
jgi:hypothetical protein